MHTILGAGGSIANELAKALKLRDIPIRLVSRNPKKIHATDTILAADVLKYEEVDSAIKGSEVVYLTVGFPYNAKVWERNWRPAMVNVIRACKKYDAKLIFFDNVYMYDPTAMGQMTESTAVNPSSKKGKVRARIAQTLMEEIEKGKLVGLIARCADFYGPNIEQNSVLNETVLKNLSVGKKANWLGRIDVPHSFTYTPDAGEALALLGTTEDAFGEIWHLPTASQPLTGKEWIEATANELNVSPKYQVAPKFLVRLIGLFVPVMRETVELMYQYEQPYIFDSSKFERRFNFQPTSYEEGLKAVIAQNFS